MFQLQSDDLTLLAPLYRAAMSNDPVLRSFLSLRVPGCALVDDELKPTAAAVAVNYRFVFFGGQPSRRFHEQAIAHLRRQHALDVVWPAGKARLPQAPVPDQVLSRLEFRRRENRGPAHLDALAANAPHTEVQKITSRTMRRCLWRDDVLRATGSTSEFLGHGLGFCLTLEEEIVAEAYAVIWSDDRAEIATVTHPAHRGRGYASVVCAALIKACEGVGLRTYWNCDADNVASVRLAARLGFDDLQPYRLLRYEPQSLPAKAARPRSRFGGFARRLFGRSALKS